MAKKLYNARASWEESMPPLAVAFTDFKGFAKGELKVNRIYDLLVVFIQRHRRPVERRFYPARDLAEIFGVSDFTIASVYRRLHREGLLSIVRSSQTMIPPRAPRTRFAVRGTVAMPIWSPTYLHFIDWRQWFAIIQEELARYRFVAEPIFYRPGEEINRDFVDRVLRFDPDYILWFFPSTTDMATLLSLTDTGVSLLTVSGYHENFPGRSYPMSDGQAFQQGLREWRESGEIDEIILPRSGPDTILTETLKSALENHSFPHRFEVYSEHKPELPKFLAHLASQPRKGVIFDDILLYARLCLWAPEAMIELFRRRRTLVLRHVLFPGAKTAGVTVDSVSCPWSRLARRIALDLSQAKGGIFSRQPVIQVNWRPQTPLSEISQVDCLE